MATRSTIAMSVPGGVKAIYCHWDGDIVGETLRAHYATLHTAGNLLDLGNLSSLGASLSETISYKTMQDRDEPARVFKNRAEWINWATSADCEYAYLFKNGAWSTERIS
jgi:hypothetical protein